MIASARIIEAGSKSSDSDSGLAGVQLGGISGLETIKSVPRNEINRIAGFSTKEKPAESAKVISIFSTKETAESLSQLELINSDLAAWKSRKNRPPYPPGHCLNPAGRKEKGRRVFTGFQILRRAKCQDCNREIRKVAAYISATQLIELERESNHVKIGIIKNLLRRTAGRIDRDLIGLQCPACSSRCSGDRLAVS